jgi:hypothetical protein
MVHFLFSHVRLEHIAVVAANAVPPNDLTAVVRVSDRACDESSAGYHASS